MTSPTIETVDVLGGRLSMQVSVLGEGEPLVYLHSAGGLKWDACMETLAERYKVYAPYFPGTHPSDPNAIEQIETLWDAVLAYDDLLDALKLDSVRLVGHSFGGMLACELAAQRREQISKLAVISPVGLWLEDAPYTCATFTAIPPEELPGILFHRLEAEEVKRYLAVPEDPVGAAEADIALIWTLACTCKVIWPIPDKGLDKRIHRVTAPSLVVWGDRDRLISSVYAKEFARQLPEGEVFILPDTGHCPTIEDPERAIPRLQDFLA